MKRASLLWCLMPAVLATSCTAPAAPTSTTSTSTTSTSSTTTSTTAEPPEVAPCLAGDQPFAGDGALATGLADNQEGDAESVVGLRWSEYPGCEQLVVELSTAGGAPATETGGVRAELLRDFGIVRLRLDNRVATTAVADRVVERNLVDRVYVVRSSEGGLFVDIHLGSAVLARASVKRSPAEIVVDLQPGGPPLPSRPLTNDSVVVITPTTGRGEYPIRIEGYARTFEATVVLRLRQGGELAVEETTTTADYLITWGEYRFLLSTGPTGTTEYFIGEVGAEDGRELGAVFTLQMD